MITVNTTVSVAFQGEPGAYSELAATRYFSEPIETCPKRAFEDVFEADCSPFSLPSNFKPKI